MCPIGGDSSRRYSSRILPIFGRHSLLDYPLYPEDVSLFDLLPVPRGYRIRLSPYGSHHFLALGYFSCSIYHASPDQWSDLFTFHARLLERGLSLDTFGLCSDWDSQSVILYRRRRICYRVDAIADLSASVSGTSAVGFHLRDIRHIPFRAYSTTPGPVGDYALGYDGYLYHVCRGGSSSLGRLPSVFLTPSLRPDRASLAYSPCISYLSGRRSVLLVGSYGLFSFDLSSSEWSPVCLVPWSGSSHMGGALVFTVEDPSVAIISSSLFVLKPSFACGDVYMVSVPRVGFSWECRLGLVHFDFGDIVFTGAPNRGDALLVSGWVRCWAAFYDVPVLPMGVLTVLDVFYREALIHCVSLVNHSAAYLSDL